MANYPLPVQVHLHRQSRELELVYAEQGSYRLPAEFLRVYSPSAEVQGHGQPVLQTGKIHVALTNITQVGRYALKLVFDDGHDSGLYNWEYLYEMCTHYEKMWQRYLEQLNEAGASRDPDVTVVQLL